MKQISTNDLKSACKQIEDTMRQHGSSANVTGGVTARSHVRFDLTDTAPAAAVEELAQATGRPVTRGHDSITVWKSEKAQAGSQIRRAIMEHLGQ